MADTNISLEDKQKFLELMNSNDTDDALNKIDELPDSIYDRIKPSMDINSIKSLSLILAILYILSSLFSYIQQLMMARVTNNIKRFFIYNY